ncbi:helix-turn-helix transcriptional regulator [Flexivirga sp. B27]
MDDIDKMAPQERHRVLQRCKEHAILLIATAQDEGAVADGLCVAVPLLDGKVNQPSIATSTPSSSELTEAFVLMVRQHNPSFSPTSSDHASMSCVCSASFGIPAELDLLAQLTARHGLETVVDAVRAPGTREQIVELLSLLQPAQISAEISAEDGALLSTLLLCPGGATESLLRRVLPGTDVSAVTTRLQRAGLIHQVLSTGPGRPVRRAHLRVSAIPTAAQWASSCDIPLVMAMHGHAEYLVETLHRLSGHMHGSAEPQVTEEFLAESPNLHSVIAMMLESGQHGPAVDLMVNSLPLLRRCNDVDSLYDPLLHVLAGQHPAAVSEDFLLLAAEVFGASGESEAAHDHLDRLPAGYPGAEVLRAILSDSCDVVREVAEMPPVKDDPILRTTLQLSLLATLFRQDESHEIQPVSRQIIAEGACRGERYSPAIALLWQAVATDDCAEAFAYVDRAITKLRPLGATLLLAAVVQVADAVSGVAPTQNAHHHAQLLGAISRLEIDSPTASSGLPTPVSELECALSARIGGNTMVRQEAQGAEGDPITTITQLLRGLAPTATAPVLMAERPDSHHGSGPVRMATRSELTNRETEVAALVSEGMTNRQIAGRLRISEWTVINHLRSVMRKLDVSSRVQVATWVHDTEPIAT